MKLNQECVRDLLLSIEEVSIVNKTYSLAHYVQNSALKEKSYTEDELMYVSDRLVEAGFIKGQPNFDFEYYYISTLTYEGHTFLDTIRDSNVWTLTKNVTSKVSSVPLSVLSEIANSTLRKLLNLE